MLIAYMHVSLQVLLELFNLGLSGLDVSGERRGLCLSGADALGKSFVAVFAIAH